MIHTHIASMDNYGFIIDEAGTPSCQYTVSEDTDGKNLFRVVIISDILN